MASYVFFHKQMSRWDTCARFVIISKYVIMDMMFERWVVQTFLKLKQNEKCNKTAENPGLTTKYLHKMFPKTGCWTVYQELSLEIGAHIFLHVAMTNGLYILIIRLCIMTYVTEKCFTHQSIASVMKSYSWKVWRAFVDGYEMSEWTFAVHVCFISWFGLPA